MHSKTGKTALTFPSFTNLKGMPYTFSRLSSVLFLEKAILGNKAMENFVRIELSRNLTMH